MANAKPQVFIIVSLGALVASFMASFVGYMTLQSAPADAPGPEQVAPVEPPPRVDPSPPPAPPEPAAPPPAPREARTKLDPAKRMTRDLKREQIWRALGSQPGANKQPSGTDQIDPGDAPAPRSLPPLSRKYIKDAIAEQLVPVARECYESALEDEPELEGKLVVEFMIVGAEEVGGIVESALISPSSTLHNPFLSDCMRESVMAVTFEPPEDGGQVKVSYPFVFQPG